jgi:hypothetical protein
MEGHAFLPPASSRCTTNSDVLSHYAARSYDLFSTARWELDWRESGQFSPIRPLHGLSLIVPGTLYCVRNRVCLTLSINSDAGVGPALTAGEGEQRCWITFADLALAASQDDGVVLKRRCRGHEFSDSGV